MQVPLVLNTNGSTISGFFAQQKNSLGKLNRGTKKGAKRGKWKMEKQERRYRSIYLRRQNVRSRLRCQSHGKNGNRFFKDVPLHPSSSEPL